jgi:hypothetical protein
VQDPYNTTSCVKLSFGTIGNINAPSGVHAITNKKDILPKCTSVPPQASEQPCVQTSNNRSRYRLVYGLRSGANSVTRLDSFAEDTNLKDCADGTVNEVCQKIMGVDRGDFNDISVNFPLTESSNITTEQVASANITDFFGNPHEFQATIVRTPTERMSAGIIQQPNQICIYEGTNKTKLIGCIDRIQGLPKPNVYSCGTPGHMSCTSTHFAPKIIVELKSGLDATEGVLEVQSSALPTAPIKINLAGFEYTAFATDDENKRMPFESPPAKDSRTIYGIYSPAGEPLDGSGNRNTSMQYVTGLEYIAGKYNLGGKKVCLSSFETERCTDNKQNCVLAKLENNNVVSCKTFFSNYLNTKYTTLAKCNSSSNACPIIDTMPKLASGSINIRECTTTTSSGAVVKSHCYDYSDNLCLPTFNASDRVYPPYSGVGTEALADNEYLDYQFSANDSKIHYANNTKIVNEDTEIIRDKTEIEHGLCVEVPKLKCTAIDETAGNSAENGYASWAEADAGSEITGSCIVNYSQTVAEPVKRNCVIDFSSGTPQTKFGTLINGYTCKSSGIEIAGADNLTIAALTIQPKADTNYSGNPAEEQIFTLNYTYPTGGNTQAESYREFIIKVNIPDITKVPTFNLVSANYRGSAYVIFVNDVRVESHNCNNTICVQGASNNLQTIWGSISTTNLLPQLINGENLIKIQVNKGRQFPVTDGSGQIRAEFNYIRQK